MRYASLYEFTDMGIAMFEKAFTSQIDEDAIDLNDPQIATPVSGTRPFEVTEFETAHALASAVLGAGGSRKLPELLPSTGLWAWLTFVLRDVVFPRGKDGKRPLGEVHRWYPSAPNNYQKAQRHLVRMPVTLLATLGRNADHLLCGKPSVHGDLREQLTSSQDMFHEGFQGAARLLYFDDSTGKLKPGSGGKGAGSPRRLAKVRWQFDVTWDLFALPSARFVGMLPNEFDRFKPVAALPGRSAAESVVSADAPAA